MNYLIGYHDFLVKAMLFIIVLNLAAEYFLRNNLINFVKYSRIGFFAFWAFWAMAVFAGFIVFAFQKGKMSAAVTVMILAAVVLAVLEGYRAIKLGKIWKEKKSGLKFSAAVLAAEIAVTVLTAIFSVVYK